MNQPDPSPRPSFRKRVLRRLYCCSCRVGLLILLLLLFLYALPWMLAKTSFRDHLLTTIVNNNNLNVQCRDASLGYSTPLSVTGLRIESDIGSTLIEVERIEAEYSWLELLASRPELGTFQVERPVIDVVLQRKQKRQDPNRPHFLQKFVNRVDLPVVTAEIHDASVAIRTAVSPEPPIDLHHLDATFRIEREHDQMVLRVDETNLFDHQKITPESFRHGLQLVAPLLASKMNAEGEFSLKLDKFEVPLGKTETPRNAAMQIEGEIEFHRVSVALKNTIVAKMADVLNTLTNYSRPKRIAIESGTKVRLKMVNGRVYHQGLSILLPVGDSSIRFVSSGSVGLDETLDLRVAIQFPWGPLRNTVLARKLMRNPVVIRCGGTLKNPQIMLEIGLNLAETLDVFMPGDNSQEFETKVGGFVDNVFMRSSQAVKPMMKKPIFMKIRSRVRRVPFLKQ